LGGWSIAIAIQLLGCFGWLLECCYSDMVVCVLGGCCSVAIVIQLLGCFGWLLECCYSDTVVRVFRVVVGVLL